MIQIQMLKKIQSTPPNLSPHSLIPPPHTPPSSHGRNDAGSTTEFWPGKDCPVDSEIGLDDPNNVYSCKPEEECCTKDLKPACCAAMPTDMMIEDQVSLWVPLAIIILVLGLFVWFCRSDASLLDGETPCLQKFCSCCGYKKRGDDGHLHVVTQHPHSSPLSPRLNKVNPNDPHLPQFSLS